MKESNLRKSFLPKWQLESGPLSKLFRNNTGSLKSKDGRIVIFGIGLWRRKNRKSPYRPVGGGDLIGWTSRTVCQHLREIGEDPISELCLSMGCELCGFNKQIAIFTSIELKTKGVYETQDQKDWKQMVIKAGGIAETVREE